MCIVLLASSVCYAAGPWKGRVIDSETKQPIEGAAVVAVWEKEWAGLGAGASTDFLDAVETTTDNNGDFEIPAHSFVSIPYFRKVKGPFFTIFKPSYGSFPNFQTSPLEIPDDYFLNKRGVIELPAIVEKEKRLKSLHAAESVIDDIPKSKIRNFINIINDENLHFGFETYKED